MSRIKRVVCLVLVPILVMCLVFTTGCTKKEDVGENGVTMEGSTTKGTTTAQEVSAKPEYAKVSWYHPQDTADSAEQEAVFAAINKKLMEEMNVEIDWQISDYGTYGDKMSLLAASNEPIDIMFTASWINPFIQLVSKGALLPIGDIIEKSAPKLKEAIPEFVWPAGQSGGKQYAVPNYQVFFQQWGMIFQKSLVDKYSFDISTVKTPQDLEPLLKVIKEKEPNIYPTEDILPLWYFKYETVGIDGAAIKQDGSNGTKLVNIFETPEYIEELALKRDWYNKGYIRKDILTVGDHSPDRKAGKYFVWTGILKPGGEAEMKASLGFDIVTTPLQEPYVQAAEGTGTMNAIGANSEHPERAIQVLEAFNTDKELYNLKIFGIEDRNYTKISEDTIKFVEGRKYAGIPPAWAIANQFNAYYTEGQQPGTWEKTIKMNLSAVVSPIRGFAFDPEPLKTQIATINAVVQEYHVAISKGAIEYEDKYEEFLGKLKTVGIDEYIAGAQKQIDDWLNTK